jgi:hypothetical protein
VNSVAEYIRELGGPDGHLYIDRLHAVATGKHSNPRAMLTAIAVLLERAHLERAGPVPQVNASPKAGVRTLCVSLLRLMTNDPAAA